MSTKRNHLAKELRSPKYRQRRLKNKKKYTRKAKHILKELNQ